MPKKQKGIDIPYPEMHKNYTTIPHGNRRIVKLSFKPVFVVVGEDNKTPVSAHTDLKNARAWIDVQKGGN